MHTHLKHISDRILIVFEYALRVMFGSESTVKNNRKSTLFLIISQVKLDGLNRDNLDENNISRN